MENTRISKIGVIGDVHCNATLLGKAIQCLTVDCEKIICLGDIVDGFGDANRCIEMLSENGVESVLGNHDEWCLQGANLGLKNATRREDLNEVSISYLKGLKRTIDIDNRFHFCHGLGENNTGKINSDDFGYALESNEEYRKLITDRRIELVVRGHQHLFWHGNVRGLEVLTLNSLVSEKPFIVKLNTTSSEIEVYGLASEEFEYLRTERIGI